jgi:proline iminopeptidase
VALPTQPRVPLATRILDEVLRWVTFEDPMSYQSKISDAEWRYPQPHLRASGHLNVSAMPRHDIYWEEYGNSAGEPVMFLHGGPGGATQPVLARFFDPERYRIVLFHQRGCGKSTPNASEVDPKPALTDNTTPHLVEDIVKLRKHLGIQGKMHVFGGSWGSTLSLAYAVAHPETVQTLIVRGIFLCRRKEIDYFYQGNAAKFASDPHDTSVPGTYLCYPEAWKPFVEVIDPADRHDMVKAYATIFARQPKTEREREQQTAAAVAWSMWEGATSYLAQDLSDLGKFADPDFAKAFALIENHYFMNGAFFTGEGEAHRDQNYLLENVARIAHLPIYIVHGRYDQVCPMFQAEDLVAALRAADAKQIDYRLTAAGHSMQERETHRELTDIMDNLPRMVQS